MKEATKRAASEALAQMLAVTAMLVIASFIFYVAVQVPRSRRFVARRPSAAPRVTSLKLAS
jgi:hypothetical protein